MVMAMVKNKTINNKSIVEWVCTDCGTKYGKWYQGGKYSGPEHHCATYHYNSCDVCGANNVPVTEPRDFGYLIKFNLQQQD